MEHIISNTLQRTKQATFAIVIPHTGLFPLGTGFFVSWDGWFITAAHCVTDINKPDRPVRENIEKAWLMKESKVRLVSPADNAPHDKIYQNISIEYIDHSTDFALMKVDIKANQNGHPLIEKTGFPFIDISSRELDEGETVYAFNYPISSKFIRPDPYGSKSFFPRVTSAIVSSTCMRTEIVETNSDAKVYLLDKALNYGNSGGPIIATETGNVHALSSDFLYISNPQDHEGGSSSIKISSMYCVVASLANPSILQKLNECDIPISKI
jgi:serine protease Do